MKVSICMITYNHEEYVSKAIESILAQVTTFDIELIIGEDNSTDQTKGICEGYASRFSDKVKLITSDVNVGMAQNFLRTYNVCKVDASYIAFCEGDDYWIDACKLQKQIDFLESNKDCSACFHNVNIKQQRDGQNSEWILHGKLAKDNFDTTDILGPWFIPSPSIVFVNYNDFVIPDWFFNCLYSDLPFMLLLSLRGNFRYLDEVMAVYRLHDKGATTIHKNYDKIIVMVYIYASFNIHTKYKYQDAIRKSCIYEIDRHVPGSNKLNPTVNRSVTVSLQQWYQKIKEVVYKKLFEKSDTKN